MEVSYRRTPPSLLERAFARLLKHPPVPASAVVQIDFFNGADPEFWRD